MHLHLKLKKLQVCSDLPKDTGLGKRSAKNLDNFLTEKSAKDLDSKDWGNQPDFQGGDLETFQFFKASKTVITSCFLVRNVWVSELRCMFGQQTNKAEFELKITTRHASGPAEFGLGWTTPDWGLLEGTLLFSHQQPWNT